MASYDSWYQLPRNSGKVVKLLASAINGSDYVMFPNRRGMKFADLTQDCDVHFTKAFWSINEDPNIRVMCLSVQLCMHTCVWVCVCVRMSTHPCYSVCVYCVCMHMWVRVCMLLYSMCHCIQWNLLTWTLWQWRHLCNAHTYVLEVLKKLFSTNSHNHL